MITPKQWSDFRKWRESEYDKMIRSKEYKEVINRFPEPLGKPPKKRLLFWNVDTEWTHGTYVKHHLLEMISLNLLEMKLGEIPKETVENCLTWLADKKRPNKK